MVICLLCPLFIPWLIKIDKPDTKNVNNDDNNNNPSNDAATSTENDHPPMPVEKILYRFYTAPIVKFCYHSVTTGIHRLNSFNVIFSFSPYQHISVKHEIVLWNEVSAPLPPR